MSDIAIRVENLSKRYRIGLKEEKSETLFGAMSNLFRYPIDNLKRVRSLTHFKAAKQDPEDIIWALRDVSIEVRRGEVVGVIGRNGAGKSTLLKILSRITDPTSGRVVINGRVSSLLEVGTGFHRELTGRENIYLNGSILGMKKSEIYKKFDEIVDFSGVEKFIDTPVKRYSSGMQVRLAFSVAAHLEPEILMIDEVLAVGDIEFQKKCLGKMEDVAKEGRTVLFVSHNMSAVETLCNRCCIIQQGRLNYDGKVSEAINVYSKNAKPNLRYPKISTLQNDKLIAINEVWTENSKGEIINVIKTGETINFNISISVFKTLVENISIQIGIYTSGGILISLLNSSNYKKINLKNGNNNIKCSITPFILNRGLYNVNISLLINNLVVEGCENIYSFFVDGIFNNYIHVLPSKGSIVFKQKWE
ncbi:MAG TPA: ABC transporter ATP-binding protein [bacterium]|nr:ABC transporter ATP-binding protein [bacterium]